MMPDYFIRSQEAYEEMADRIKDDATLRYGAKDYWLRYILCHHSLR